MSVLTSNCISSQSYNNIIASHQCRYADVKSDGTEQSLYSTFLNRVGEFSMLSPSRQSYLIRHKLVEPCVLDYYKWAGRQTYNWGIFTSECQKAVESIPKSEIWASDDHDLNLFLDTYHRLHNGTAPFTQFDDISCLKPYMRAVLYEAKNKIQLFTVDINQPPFSNYAELITALPSDTISSIEVISGQPLQENMRWNQGFSFLAEVPTDYCKYQFKISEEMPLGALHGIIIDEEIMIYCTESATNHKKNWSIISTRVPGAYTGKEKVIKALEEYNQIIIK